jgi:nucleoid DNA-binding protein
VTIYVKDLAEVIAERCGITVKQKAQEITQEVFDKIIAQLNAGNKVYVSGFGEFSFLDKPARKARNPKTGEQVDVGAYKKMVFKPVKEFRKIK